MRLRSAIVPVALSLAGAAGVQAVDIQTVSVGYVFNIGMFEVTAGQYTEFLNAVAAGDTYGLYNENMAQPSAELNGCNIQRSGSSPNYTYSVGADWADRPVNYVSWGDATRFANWLHNGQPTGAQDLSTTEGGSYYLVGAMSDPELLAIVREPHATWVIPSEREWYKAAYHMNDGSMYNQYDYPTQSNTYPTGPELDVHCHRFPVLQTHRPKANGIPIRMTQARLFLTRTGRKRRRRSCTCPASVGRSFGRSRTALRTCNPP